MGIKCDYGCGQVAKYSIGKKNCCSKYYTQCPSIRLKNSKGVSKAHKEGKCFNFSNQQKLRGCDVFKENLKNKYKTMLYEDKPYAERRRILLKEQNEKCSECGISQTWNNKHLVFHLDHVDGNHDNNKRENNRLLCPNCHSQTKTYCRSNK